MSITPGESKSLFDKIMNSGKFTNADKDLLRNYAVSSWEFKTSSLGKQSLEYQQRMRNLIEKAKVEFPEETILTRKFWIHGKDKPASLRKESGNYAFDDVKFDKAGNPIEFSLQDRPGSFSAGQIGEGHGNDRIVLSGKNAKAVENNFVKQEYNPTIDPEYYKNLRKEDLIKRENIGINGVYEPMGDLHYGLSRIEPSKIAELAEAKYAQRAANVNTEARVKELTDIGLTKEDALKEVQEWVANNKEITELYGNPANKEEALAKIIEEARKPYPFSKNIRNELEMIGTGFDMKVVGKVKNDIGGFDYIVKPLPGSRTVKQKKEGGFKTDPPFLLPPMNTLKPVEVKANRFDTSKYPDLGINQPLPTYRPIRKSTLEEEVYWNQVPDWYKKWGKDDITEDVIEFLDPTGIVSHDDAKRAYDSWKESGRKDPTPEEGLEMFGAVPALGKFGKIKYVKKLDTKEGVKSITKHIPWQQILNTVGFGKDIYEQADGDKKEKGGFETGDPEKPKPKKPRGVLSDPNYKVIEGKYVFTLPDGRSYAVDNKSTANKMSKFIKSGKWGWVNEDDGDGFSFGRLRPDVKDIEDIEDIDKNTPTIFKKEDSSKSNFKYQIRPTYGNMGNLIYNPKVYTSDYGKDIDFGNRHSSDLMYAEPYQEREFYKNTESPDYENINLKSRSKGNYAYSVIIDGEEYLVDHPYEGSHKGYGYVNIPNRGEFEIDYRSGKPELKKAPVRFMDGGSSNCYTCNRSKLKRYSK